MTTLSALYQKEGAALFTRLNQATGADPKYLYQIATGRRVPSPKLAKKLAEAEPDLSFEELLLPPKVVRINAPRP